jgi:hypothetical protein
MGVLLASDRRSLAMHLALSRRGRYSAVMRNRSIVGLFVAGIATTFTLGASAGFLKPPDDEGATTAMPSAPSTPPTLTPQTAQAPAPAAANPNPPALVVTDVGPRPAPRLPKELDSIDPWESSPKSLAAAAPRTGKPKPRPLDSEDPWASSPTEPALPVFAATKLDASDPWAGAPRVPTTSSKPSHHADDVLREAIKRAIDAGELERAGRLLEILRTPF